VAFQFQQPAMARSPLHAALEQKYNEMLVPL
jgi:hypothetical protein